MSGADTRSRRTTDAATEKSSQESGLTTVQALRARHPILDHAIRTIAHYNAVKGNALAGGITYFGFLSFFPIMVLAFAVVGWVAQFAEGDLVSQMVDAMQSILPVVVEGDAGPGEISVQTFQDAAGTAAGIGAITALYSGLGWLSGMRQAMSLTFEMPQDQQPNFVVGKLRDLLSLVAIGLVLVLSVVVAGGISLASNWLLGLLGLSEALSPLVTLLSIAIGLLANVLLFYCIFRLLANPPTPRMSLLRGAILGAVGFELLKQIASVLFTMTTGQPAFAVFGIALILLVWINYFSRLLVYSAAWAHTNPAARFERERRMIPETIEDRVHAYQQAPVPAAPWNVDPDHPTPAGRGARTAVSAGVIGAVAGFVLGRRGD